MTKGAGAGGGEWETWPVGCTGSPPAPALSGLREAPFSVVSGSSRGSLQQCSPRHL